MFWKDILKNFQIIFFDTEGVKAIFKICKMRKVEFTHTKSK